MGKRCEACGIYHDEQAWSRLRFVLAIRANGRDTQFVLCHCGVKLRRDSCTRCGRELEGEQVRTHVCIQDLVTVIVQRPVEAVDVGSARQAFDATAWELMS